MQHSLVSTTQLVLKVFRRLAAGINPELEMLRFLTRRDYENIAPLLGWFELRRASPSTRRSASLQRLIARRARRLGLALDCVLRGRRPTADRLAVRARRGHRRRCTRCSPPTAADPAFAPEEPTAESIALLAATIDEQIERISSTLPDDDRAARARSHGHGQELREQLRKTAQRGSTAG